MNVEIISKDANWLDTIWVAIRTCKSAMTPAQLFKAAKEKPAADKIRLIKAVYKSKHLSVFEHVKVTFGVEGVSRALLAQYTRHRIGVSFSVQSQRYVSESAAKNNGEMFDYVTPGTVNGNEDSYAVFLTAMASAQKSYDDLISMGVPPEDARFILPGGAATNFVTTLNLRALFDVYEKRVTVKGAQWEIRNMLSEMMAQVIAAEPWVEELIREE